VRALIARKVARLVDAVDDLRRQVRVAFATELSKAISATVRDVLAALLGGRPVSDWEESVDACGRRSGPDDDWDDAYPAAGPHGDDDDDDDDFVPPRVADPAAAVTPAAVTLAVAAGSWLYRLSRSRLCGVAGTVAVGLAAVFGGPLTRSVVTVAAAVHQLTGAGEVLAPPRD